MDIRDILEHITNLYILFLVIWQFFNLQTFLSDLICNVFRRKVTKPTYQGANLYFTPSILVTTLKHTLHNKVPTRHKRTLTVPWQ